MPVKPIPDGYHSVTPYLIVKGAARGHLDFYKKAFWAPGRSSRWKGYRTGKSRPCRDRDRQLARDAGGRAPRGGSRPRLPRPEATPCFRSSKTRTTSTSGSRALSPRARSSCARSRTSSTATGRGCSRTLRLHLVALDAQRRFVARRAPATGRGGAQRNPYAAGRGPAMARSFLRIALVFLATRALLVVATFIPWPLPPCTEYEVRALDGAVLEVVKVPWQAGGRRPLHHPSRQPGSTRSRGWTRAITSRSRRSDTRRSRGSQPSRNAPGSFRDTRSPSPAWPTPSTPWSASRGRRCTSIRYPGLVAAFLVSNGALLLAAFALFRLAHIFLEEPVAEGSAIALLVSPVSFFGSAYLAESLFLALSVTCLLFAFRRRMGWAAILGCAAAFTRPVGVLLVVPLLMISLRARAESRRVVRDCLLLLLVPAGALDAGLARARARYARVPRGAARVRPRRLSRLREHPRAPADRRQERFVADPGRNPGCRGRARGPLLRAALFATRPEAAACARRLGRAVDRVRAPIKNHLLSMPRYVFSAFPVFIGAAMLVPRVDGRRSSPSPRSRFRLRVSSSSCAPGRSWSDTPLLRSARRWPRTFSSSRCSSRASRRSCSSG